VAGLDDADADPLRALADQVASLRAADPGQLDLVRELLAVLFCDAEGRGGAVGLSGWSWVGRRGASGLERGVRGRPSIRAGAVAASSRTIERSWAFGASDACRRDRRGHRLRRGGHAPGDRGGARRERLTEIHGEIAEVVADEAIDPVGHGTACAGIIHALAPKAELVSVRVLGADNRGKGLAFARGLDWAIQRGASVVNLSLSSRSEALYATFHELADRAYFANCLLVCAANNVAVASYPSLFAAAVVSVAAHDLRDPETWFYNPHPGRSSSGLRPGRRRRLARWRPDRRDRQQLRGAPPSPGSPHGSVPPTRPPTVRGQDDPRRDRKSPVAPFAANAVRRVRMERTPRPGTGRSRSGGSARSRSGEDPRRNPVDRDRGRDRRRAGRPTERLGW
jgi:hypothetical protein